MSRIGTIFSKTKYACLMSFLVVVFIFGVVILSQDVWPLGTRCILRTDMYHQYAPFFSELREKLQSGGSLEFTWDLGLGVNFTAIIAYYLASPLNLLLILMSPDYVIEYMSVIIVIKAGLSAASMTYYLTDHAPDYRALAAVLGLFYALSGYISAYYWNLMWLDAVCCFPIAVLGLERLVRGQSGVLYGAALGFCIFTNYYISIPICIFLVFYFFLYAFLNEPDSPALFLKTGFRFVFWSIVAGGLAAVLLLPEIYAFTLTASGENTFPQYVTSYFPILQELMRHLPLVETEQALDHWPNIYCGTFVIPLFFLYLTNRRIELREKIVYIALSLIFLTGFAVNVLNFIWHGMHYPNSLPARQSFIYIFIVLFMCMRVLSAADAVTKKDLAHALGFSVIFIMGSELINDDDAFFFGSYYFAFALVMLYMGLLHLYRKGRLSGTLAMAIAMLIAVAELSANTAYTALTTTSRTSFLDDNADVRSLARLAAEDAGGFYRIERRERKTKDDGAWLNYPSASLFSSMVNKDLSSFYKKFGMEASTNAYSVTGSTELADMFLGIGYELSTSSAQVSSLKSLIGQSGTVSLYKNSCVLSPAFILPESLLSEWMLEIDDPALVHNSLADTLGIPQILIPVYNGGASAEGEFAVTMSEEGIYYAFEGNDKAGDITVRWPDAKKTFSNLDRGYFMELGWVEKGTLLNFSAEKKTDPEVIIYKLSESAVREAYEILSAHEMSVDAYGDDFLEGSVNVDCEALGYISGEALMLVTVPFDAGWTVYVDSVKTETEKGLDTFLAFRIADGEHSVRMEYTPVGLRVGALISLISLIIVLLALFRLRHEKKARERADEARDEKKEGCLP